MMRSCVLCILCLLTLQSIAQKIPLVRSGEVLAKGNELYDSAKYEEAIQEYKKIPKRDTNYVTMLYRMGLAYSAHKKYDSALNLFKQVLSHPIDFRARVIRAQANCITNSGQFDQGIAAFDEALRQYPVDQGLLTSRAAQYYDEKKYEKAKQIYFQILSMNPFNMNAHLNLALLSMGQGRKAHAMLSMGMYLAIQTKDNSRLVFINKFLDNQLQDEGTIPAFGVNASDKLDQIIRAKISLDKKFKSQIPIEAAVVKQYELLFDQLAMLDANNNDEWVNFYLPIYKAIKDQQQVQPFIYHLLTSSSNEIATKWRNKNEKLLTELYQNVNKAISAKTQKMAAPKFNVNTPLTLWRDDSGFIDALGEKKNDIRVGQWIFFHNNSELQAEGTYNDKGEKIGTWKYYYDLGTIKSIENYDTGEVTVYSTEGNKSEYFFLKDDEIHGEVILYYPCGVIREKSTYDKGKRNGPTQIFYASGKIHQKYAYKDGKFHGPVDTYYEDGKQHYQMTYSDGKLNGSYVEYHRNGKKSTEGNYVNGNETGTWKYYHTNGKMKRSGSYSPEGVGIGEWLYYNVLGQLTESRIFDEEGRYTGENTIFNDGVKQYAIAYKKGVAVKTTSYAKDGKVIFASGANDGNYSAKYYFATGQLMSEGGYKKGNNHGEWKYYNRYGKLTERAFFEDAKLQGIVRDYYSTGEIKIEKEYKDGELHGYYMKYYQNGKKMQEGWYQNGEQEQQWLSYYPDGTIQSDYYYRNGKLMSDNLDYAMDGKVDLVSIYDENGIADVNRFLKDGTVESTRKTEGAAITIEDLFSSGKVKSKYTISCGSYINDFTRYFPDGSLMYKNTYTNDKRNGKYVYVGINGQQSTDGYYENDLAEGTWRYYYYNGKLSSEGNYRDGSMDSIWTYYHENGKLESVGVFLDDERQGITRYYSPEGNPLFEKKLDEGVMLAYRSIVENENAEWKPFTGSAKLEFKNKNGVVQWMEEWKDGVRQGKQKLFYENGTLFSEYSYEKGNFQGPTTIYYPSGKVWMKRFYEWDELEGKSEVYAEDGSLIQVVDFHFGIRNGKATLFEKGVKKKEYNFRDGIIEE
ncbi:MAG: tetratricopeptide repeat protein [Cyclobacteriaceae bacterium]|nr:tetratricopeptide repeat protein [Cyclobacteriaceae bacterium]